MYVYVCVCLEDEVCVAGLLIPKKGVPAGRGDGKTAKKRKRERGCRYSPTSCHTPTFTLSQSAEGEEYFSEVVLYTVCTHTTYTSYTSYLPHAFRAVLPSLPFLPIDSSSPGFGQGGVIALADDRPILLRTDTCLVRLDLITKEFLINL